MSMTIVQCYEAYTNDKMGDVEKISVEDIESQDMTPKEFTNPQRHCWRISVPYHVKTVFEDENFYPSQWKFHQFFPARLNHKHKKSNADGEAVETLLVGGK